MTPVTSSSGATLAAEVSASLRSVIHGKPEAVDVVTIGLLAEGSILIDDIPGVGKTTLAKALARSIDARFGRIQFTPDLLPAEVLGSSVYNPVTGAFDFRKGPIFCNILLADEINRASPRTQSALLEAMNERQATVEGTRFALPRPFMVLATQNPIEFLGTYPLPEAQLDRFMIALTMGYPEPDVETEIVASRVRRDPLDALRPVVTAEQVTSMQKEVTMIHAERAIWRYVVDIARATREDPRIQLPVSPRGCIMLARAAQAAAFAAGRDYCLPDDVQRMAAYVLSHRIVLAPKSRYEGTGGRQVIADILGRVSVPT
ncbi:MAG: magnesium chelatase [Phycisphaeraceae bacterium]|nr:magnesium chelatase [Phycisphaeraceae bacterium]